MATTHLPGTLGKIVVMSRRASLGLPLFQTGDAPIPDTGGPVTPPPTVITAVLPAALYSNYRKYLNAWDSDLHWAEQERKQ
jgi:hypothetical protein